MNATATQRAHVLADLETRTTPQTATAPVETGLRTGSPITGQYLYDRFIGNNDADQTLMDVVRAVIAAQNVDVASWKAACADMVKRATEADGGNTKGPKTKTARNHQSMLRNAYGALRFAPSELVEAGYTERTGYQEMRVLAKAALAQRGMTWEGHHALSPSDRQRQKQQKAEAQALADIQKFTPRNIDETLQAYTIRTMELVPQYLERLAEADKKDRVNGLAMRVIEMCGDDVDAVIQLIMDEGVAWPQAEQQQAPQQEAQANQA